MAVFRKPLMTAKTQCFDHTKLDAAKAWIAEDWQTIQLGFTNRATVGQPAKDRAAALNDL